MARRTKSRSRAVSGKASETTYVDVFAVGIAIVGIGAMTSMLLPLWQALLGVGLLLLAVVTLGMYLSTPKEKRRLHTPVQQLTYVDVFAIGIAIVGIGSLSYMLVPLWQSELFIGVLLVSVSALGMYLSKPRR